MNAITDPIPSLLAKMDDGKATPEDLAAALMAGKTRVEQAKQLLALVESSIVAHMEATGAEFTIGTIRYYAGHRKVTTCVNPQGVMERALEAAQGDVARVVECLTANPYKLTEIRLLCGELPEGMFVTTERPELCEGKPRKKLLSADTRYTKAKAG